MTQDKELETAAKAYDKVNPFLTRADHAVALAAALSAKAAEVERLRVALCELLRAMDAEGTATMRFERMADNEGAYDESEITAAQNAAADAILTVSEAITKARRALEQSNDR